MKPNKMFIVTNDQKCGGCNWRVSNLYLMAESQKEANRLLKETRKMGGNALCCDCMAELLTDSGHAIYPLKKQPVKERSKEEN
jgi:hypothetical protein